MLKKWKKKKNNIWRVKVRRSKDIGNIILDNVANIATKKPSKDSLKNKNDFYAKKNKLYFKHINNPSLAYKTIELAIRKHIVLVIEKSYLHFENLAIKYGAANGFSCVDSSFIIINNCEVSFIGGGYLSGEDRYGNGIEFWENAKNCLVENCTIDQIFDTGLTNQAMREDAVQKNNCL